jgi:tetratricopeptide (TPR) repeat protein
VDEAMDCFRKAIRLDPKYAQAHSSLGVALQAKGQLDESIDCLRKAIRLDPKDGLYHYNLGVSFHFKGNVDEAIDCYRQAILLNPKDTKAHYNLGNALHGKGLIDEAIACYRQAIGLYPKYAKAHSDLGHALKAKGKVDEAIACFRKAILFDPKDARAHRALGQALMQQGEFSEAEKSLREWLTMLPPGHPARGSAGSALNLVQQCQELLAADGKLQALLAGKAAPADAATQVRMAQLAQQPYRRLYHTAARLYRDAFARHPNLANFLRYSAARAAALAGTGQGKDVVGLDERQRAAWRKLALDWLAADLARYAALAKKADGHPAVRKQLTHWQKDPDLAGVRDDPALAKLQEKERQAWQKLWADIAALLKTVEQK